MTPNDPYRGRTAPLTSKRFILYIYSTNIVTEHFKHAIYSPFFSLQNAVCFIILTYLVPVLFTFYIQGVLKLKNNSGAKRLILDNEETLAHWRLLRHGKNLCCVSRCSPLPPNVTCYIRMYFSRKTKPLFPCYESVAARSSLLLTVWTFVRILALDTLTLRKPWVGVFRLHTRLNPFVTTFILCATPHKSKNDLIRNTNSIFYVRVALMNVRSYCSIETVKKQTQNPRVFILFVSLNDTVSSSHYVF